MVRRILLIVSFIAFIAIFIIGTLHWNEKLESARNNGPTITANASNGTNNEDGTSNSSRKPWGNVNRVELNELVGNMPDRMAKIFKNAFDNKETVKIVVLGSPAIGDEEDGWGVIVRSQLENIYGEEFVDVVLFRFDGNSQKLLDENVAERIVDEQPDILLLEGFTLEDNTALIETSSMHENLLAFIDAVKTGLNNEVSVVLQPPNPIHRATKYPTQVEDLKKFAQSRGIPYIDHWIAWPDYKTEAIKDYLNEESYPNEKGHELWANVVIDFFAKDYETVVK